MKKKLLLIALPALMALSGCSNVRFEQVEKEDLSNLMFEDTMAHDELFGKVDNLNIKKLGVPDDDPGSTSIPRVGVQFSDVYERDTGSGKINCRAVRYVAAIKGNLSTQTAVWTRGVSETNSNQIKTMSGGHNCSEVYASLNDGNTPTGVPSGYDNFVVYTMYDIPTSQENSYIAAYLTLTPNGGGESVKSYAVVTEIDGDNYFSVNMDDDLCRNGYFLETYNSLTSVKSIQAEDNGPLTDSDPNNAEKDNAIFSQITFSEGDRVGAFRLSPTLFQFYGFDAFMESTASGYVKEANVNDYAEAHRTGVYTVFLNKDNVVYFAPNDVTGLTFNFVAWGDWDSDNARIEVYCFNEYNGNSLHEFMTWTKTGTHTYSYSPEHWGYSKIIFVRMDKTKESANWDSKWNQSGDIGVGLDLTKTTFTLTQPSSWDDWTASWIAS